MKKAIADLLPAEKLRAHDKMKACSEEMELLLLVENREKSLEEIKAAVNKDLFTSRAMCEGLRLNRNEVLPQLKFLETDIGMSLKTVS